MARQFPQPDDAHRKFIKDQHMFFVGSAARDGRVNLSPKGMDSGRVPGANRIVWLNLTGSGTGRHLALGQAKPSETRRAALPRPYSGPGGRLCSRPKPVHPESHRMVAARTLQA